jgi:hypothetical protein
MFHKNGIKNCKNISKKHNKKMNSLKKFFLITKSRKNTISCNKKQRKRSREGGGEPLTKMGDVEVCVSVS